MTPEPTVYVVDDDPDTRKALVMLVESMRLKVIAKGSAEEFLSGYTEHAPACLVSDLRMQGMSGLDLLQKLRAAGMSIPTIIITGFAETSSAVDAMRAGAVGYLEKTAPHYKICQAISQALAVSEPLLAKKLERAQRKRVRLSLLQEDVELLRLLTEGKLNKEIAAETGVALRTVEDRRRRLMAKVGAETFADLIRFAILTEEFERDE